MAETLKTGVRLGDIVQKLDVLAQPVSLFSSFDGGIVIGRVKKYAKRQTAETLAAKNQLIQELMDGRRDKEVAYELLTHLFLAARKKIVGRFDPEREAKNIDALASLLVGNSPEVKTGKGKSSTTTPIELMFRAIWEKDDGLAEIFAAPNEALLDEAIKNYTALNEYFTEGLTGEKSSFIKNKTKLVKDMSRREEGDSFDVDLFTEVFVKEPDGIVSASLVDGRVLCQTHNQMVFSMIEQAEIGKKPVPVLIDEAHQLTSERFISTSHAEEGRTPEVNEMSLRNTGLGANISSFVLAKLVYQRIGQDRTNFYYQGNGLELGRKGYRQLKKIRDDLQGALAGDQTTRQIDQIIEEFVLPGVSYHQIEKTRVVRQIRNQVLSFWGDLAKDQELKGDGSANPRHAYLVGLAEDITKTMGGITPGKDVVLDQGKIIVRESGRGILLRSHRYNVDTSFLLTVVNDELHYQYNPPFGRLRYQMGFPTWLTYAARGKVQLLTANLFDTDLRTGKKTKGSLAKILETFSEGLAESLEDGQQEKLPLPKPELFGGMDPLVDRVVAQTQARVATSPELIVCFNDYLIKDLVARFPDEKIGVISSTTPEEDTNQLLKDFADGKIRILITSGRASYGADIKKSDGQFPDFHITVINPETQTAVNQSFGRLRGEKKESNFSLFFTEDFLKQLSTLFDEKKPLGFIPTSTTREFIELIDEYKLGKNEEKFIKKLFELLGKNDSKGLGDYVFQTKLELNFLTKIRPVIVELKKTMLTDRFADHQSLLGQTIDQYMKTHNIVGAARDQIETELVNLLSLPEESLAQTYYSDASLLRLEPRFGGKNDFALVAELNETWAERMIGHDSALQQFLHSLYNNPEYIEREVIPLLQQKVGFTEQLNRLALAQIPVNGAQSEQIAEIQTIPLPEIKPIADFPAVTIVRIKANELVNIGEGRYLLLRKDSQKQGQLILVTPPGQKIKSETVVLPFYPVDPDAIQKSTRKIVFGTSSAATNSPNPKKKTFFFFPTMADVKQPITSLGLVTIDL